MRVAIPPPRGWLGQQEKGAEGDSADWGGGRKGDTERPSRGSVDVGEQLDRGWEPWGEGLGQGQTP